MWREKSDSFFLSTGSMVGGGNEIGEIVPNQTKTDWSRAIKNALELQGNDKGQTTEHEDSQLDFSVLYQENWAELLLQK